MNAHRLHLLAAMGLVSTGCGTGTLTLGKDSGRDTDWPSDDTGEVDDRTCDEAPLLTPEKALELGWEEDGKEWLVCAGDGEGCSDPEEMNTWQFLSEALGPHPDPELCGWYGTVQCGPEESVTDQCCYVMTVGQICEGRPLVIDGVRRRVLPGDGPWARAAADEHASVASFARHALELMALGAPAELLTGVAMAMADEVRHAQLCAGMAGVSLAPLEATEPVDAEPVKVLRALIREACINETIAAAIAAEAATRATGDAAEVLAVLAEDEQRHSTLAWKTLAWLIRERPELKAEAVREFARPVEVGADGAYGLVDGAAKLEVARRVMAQVVYPCAARLLRSVERPAVIAS